MCLYFYCQVLFEVFRNKCFIINIYMEKIFLYFIKIDSMIIILNVDFEIGIKDI